MNTANKEFKVTAADRRAINILRSAREVFLDKGWDGFSIESVADASKCSRPLVYKHFACKEEVILALAIESKRRRGKLFLRALEFEGKSRERMAGVGEVERILLPRDLPVELFVASTNLRVKTSQDRQDALKMLDLRCMSLATSVIHDAVREGDLVLPGTISPEEFLFTTWATYWGAANIMRSDTPLSQQGVSEPWSAINRSLSVMLDGFRWRPLSTEWDYVASVKRIYSEIFPRESVERILSE